MRGEGGGYHHTDKIFSKIINQLRCINLTYYAVVVSRGLSNPSPPQPSPCYFVTTSSDYGATTSQCSFMVGLPTVRKNWKIGSLVVLMDDSYDLIKSLDADIILVHQPPTTVNMRVRQWYCDTAMMDWTHLITPCGWGEGLQVGWEWDPGDTTLQKCRQHGGSLSSHYFLPLCDKLWSITETTSPPAGHNNIISSILNIPTTSPSPSSPASTLPG